MSDTPARDGNRTIQLQGRRRGPLSVIVLMCCGAGLTMGLAIFSAQGEPFAPRTLPFYGFFLLGLLTAGTGTVTWKDHDLRYRNGWLTLPKYNGRVELPVLASATFEYQRRGYIPVPFLVLRDGLGQKASIRWESPWDTSGWGPLVIAAIDRNRGFVDPKFRELVDTQAGEHDE